MRKLGVRVVSAALAACMMASVLPVGAFAAGTGNDDDAGVSAYANEDSTPTVLSKSGGNITTPGTYTMEAGEYTGIFVISVGAEETNRDVVINIEGKINRAGQLFRIINVGKLTINGKECTVDTSGNTFAATDENGNIGSLEVNGGTYQCSNGFFINSVAGTGFTATLKDVNVVASGVALSNNSGGTVTLSGGSYSTTGTKEALFVNGNSSKLVLENSTKNIEVRAAGTGIRNTSNSEVEITGGIFNTTGAVVWNANDNSKATITGGNFTAEDTVFNNSGTLTIGVTGAANDITITSNGTSGAVLNGKQLTFNGGTVNAVNGSGIHSVYDKQNVTTTINGGTLNCRDNISLQASGESDLNVTLGSNVTLSDTARYDVVLRENQKIGFSGSRSDEVSIWLFDPSDGRHLTPENAPSNLNIVCKNGGYTVKYNETEKYYYLSKNEEYALNLINATAEKENGADADTGEVKKEPVTSGENVPAGTTVYLTAGNAPEGKKFDHWKVTVGEKELTGADLSEVLTGSVLTMPKGATTVEAIFVEDTGDVTPGDDDTTGGSTGGNGGEIGGAIAAVVVGGAAAWGVYEAGTGIYRLMYMPGIILPTTRAELAMLIWEKADKPEPESDVPYDDIDEDNTDLQKAARWMVEQELMDEKDDNKFKPEGHVTKLRVCTTWNEAKEKGLID